MLIYITTDFEDFERGVPVKAGTLLDYTDKDRAEEIIRAGFAHEVVAEKVKAVTEKEAAK